MFNREDNTYNEIREKSLFQWLDEMEKRWPAEEAVWILKVEYCFKRGQGENIQKLLEEIERRKIYLSAEGKEKLEFLKK